VFESFPDLKKRYWGRYFWARGYFCVTSGELTEEMIKNYCLALGGLKPPASAGSFEHLTEACILKV